MDINYNNSRADQYLLHYEEHQQSTAPSINAANMTSSSSESTPVGGDQVELYHTLIMGSEQELSEISCSQGKKRSYYRSKRNMPTTMLKANPSNFQAIVQKFTGRYSDIDHSTGRKGPVTLDFKSPTSVPKDIIFPNSANIQNYNCAINMHVCNNGESHVTCDQWEGNETASNEMSQLSDDYALHGVYDDGYDHGNLDNYHNDDHDLMSEYLENNCFNGVINMDFDEFYLDAVMVEEFLMRDLDM